MSKKFNGRSRLYIISAFFCIAIGLLFALILYCNQPNETVGVNSVTNAQDPSQRYFAINGTIGDFIAGITGTLFSLAAFFLIYLSFQTQNDTLKSQNEALNNQKENFEKESIESRFFELIRLHRSNIEEIVFRNWKDGSEISKGRKVFKDVYNQLTKAIVYTTRIIEMVPHENVLKKNSFIDLFTKDEKIKKELIIGNLAYSVVFFGVAEESLEGLKNALEKDFHSAFILSFIDFFKLVPVETSIFRDDWNSFERDVNFRIKIKSHFSAEQPLIPEEIFKEELKKDRPFNKEIKLKFYKYFGGHQSKLGHYYRHLFRTVSYIDSKIIEYSDKEEYVRILRAQLSNYEQFLLFFNSICFIGREWELKHKHDEYKWLLSKFNLVRNIPYTIFKYYVDGHGYSISLTNFYPLIAYEFEEIPKGRKEFIDKIIAIDHLKA